MAEPVEAGYIDTGVIASARGENSHGPSWAAPKRRSLQPAVRPCQSAAVVRLSVSRLIRPVFVVPIWSIEAAERW